MTEGEPGLLRVVVRARQGEYPVWIGPRAARRLDAELALQAPLTRVVVCADERVFRHHAEPVLEQLGKTACDLAEPVLLAGGETQKSFAALEALLDAFADRELDRTCLVVSFGGGATSDLVGMAASLWMRGVRWAAIPTTVLASVDASVGGKTAVNLRAGKNLAGTFHAPRFVLIDPVWFDTLDECEVRSGLAEVIKSALIADRQLLALLEEAVSTPLCEMPWEPLLQRSIAVKADIVSRDETEGGVRRVLNLGHTLGHALEKTAPANSLAHGEAVAIGMCAAADFSVARGLMTAAERDRVTALVAGYSLPTAPPFQPRPDALKNALMVDKKTAAGRLFYILPRGLGDVVVRADVSVGEVLAWVERHGA